MTSKKILSQDRVLFSLALIALLMFNANRIQVRRKAQILNEIRHEKKLASDISKLSSEFTGLYYKRQRVQADKISHVADEDLIATFPDEFLVRKQDHQDPHRTTVSLFVPRNGPHRIRIEIWQQTRKLCDRFFEIESGQRSDIHFRVGDDWIETEFPNQTPIRIAIENLELAPQSVDLETPPLFVSPNQAPWRKGVAFFDEPRVGVLSEFRFNPKTFQPTGTLHHAVSVRISAESAGPMSAAADDYLTVLRLFDMASGARQWIPYRYENGRYFFE